MFILNVILLLLIYLYSCLSIYLLLSNILDSSDPDDVKNASFNSNASTLSLSGNAMQLIRAALQDRHTSTRINVCTGNVAYCPQQPPMMSGSIRSNILMGAGYDEDVYREVLEGCCLLKDLEV